MLGGEFTYIDPSSGASSSLTSQFDATLLPTTQLKQEARLHTANVVREVSQEEKVRREGEGSQPLPAAPPGIGDKFRSSAGRAGRALGGGAKAVGKGVAGAAGWAYEHRPKVTLGRAILVTGAIGGAGLGYGLLTSGVASLGAVLTGSAFTVGTGVATGGIGFIVIAVGLALVYFYKHRKAIKEALKSISPEGIKKSLEKGDIYKKYANLEDTLSQAALFGIAFGFGIGSIPFGVTKVAFGAYQVVTGIALGILGLAHSVTGDTTILKHAKIHVMHGAGNLLVGALEAIPVVTIAVPVTRRLLAKGKESQDVWLETNYEVSGSVNLYFRLYPSAAKFKFNGTEQGLVQAAQKKYNEILGEIGAQFLTPEEQFLTPEDRIKLAQMVINTVVNPIDKALHAIRQLKAKESVMLASVRGRLEAVDSLLDQTSKELRRVELGIEGAGQNPLIIARKEKLANDVVTQREQYNKLEQLVLDIKKKTKEEIKPFLEVDAATKDEVEKNKKELTEFVKILRDKYNTA